MYDLPRASERTIASSSAFFGLPKPDSFQSVTVHQRFGLTDKEGKVKRWWWGSGGGIGGGGSHIS